MEPSDLDAVGRTHLATGNRRPFSVRRDRDHWEYLVERSRSFFARLDGSDLSGRFQVAEHEGRFGGYLVSVVSGNVWIVREAAAEEGNLTASREILRAGAAQARSSGVRQVYGWLPGETKSLVPEWRLVYRPRRRAIPMFLPLSEDVDASDLAVLNSAFIPYLDQF